VNYVIYATDKQMSRISFISNKFMPKSLMYFYNNIDGHSLSMYFYIQHNIKMNELIN
jgi:hypothetical protein